MRGWGRDLLWAVPLAAFVTVGTFFAGGGDRHDAGAGLAVPMLLAGAAAVTLPLGRRWPDAALLVPGTAVAAYFALGFHDGPVYLPLLLGSYLASMRGSLRGWARSLAVVLVLVLAGMGARAGTTDLGWWQAFWQGTGTAALTVAAGLLGGLTRSRRQTAEERVRHAATEEKLRMARDLHDGVGHGLAVISMQAGVALHVLDRDPTVVRAALEAIRDTSRESLDSLRAELSVLAGETAARAPRRGLADLPDLVARVEGAGVAVRRTGDPGPLPADADAAAYAIVQEALTNVLRHADAETVEVGLVRGGGRLEIRVADDGRAAPGHDEGMGIGGMRSRATGLGGSLTAGPRAGGGFEVMAELPVPEAGR